MLLVKLTVSRTTQVACVHLFIYGDPISPKPEYEDDEDEDEPQTGRQRKKPWRYRWPDAFRDEVLALLLELNKQRAEQERLTAPAEKPKKGGRKKPDRLPDDRLF